jgi:outer membrane protein assembly factor BamE (lipoprotein component of BamABCDE complex)
MRCILKALLVLGPIFLIPFLWGAWVMEGHGMSLGRASRIKKGMTQAQVRQVAGSPYREDDRKWLYTRNTFCMINVHFDANRQVDEVDHDH